jgi:hypothetical protein
LTGPERSGREFDPCTDERLNPNNLLGFVQSAVSPPPTGIGAVLLR